MSQIVVGTAQDCDLRIADPYVSSHHAVIVDHGGSYTVTDLGSLNGTWLVAPSGMKRRVYGPTHILTGYRVLVGRTVLPWTPAPTAEARDPLTDLPPEIVEIVADTVRAWRERE